MVKRYVPAAFNPDHRPDRDTYVFPKRFLNKKVVPDVLPNEPITEVYDEEVIWGGCVQPHFGHFLTESVSRLWPLLPGGELEGLPVVCVRPSEHAYEREWEEAFGVRPVAAPENGVARFSRMYVPEPAWVLPHEWVAPEIRDIHLHARKNLDVPVLPPQGVLWLSRSRLGLELRAYDEALLEWLLQEHVTITHPQEHTLAEQVAVLEACEAVTGLVGSAFHTILGALEPPEYVILCRGTVASAHTAQDRLLDVKGTLIHALADAEMHRRRRGRSLGCARVLIPEILRALGETVLPKLWDDPRLALLAHPEAVGVGKRCRSEDMEIDTAVARVLLDPSSARARLRLARSLEDRGLDACALEQFTIVAELSDDRYVPALLGMARTLAHSGQADQASMVAERVLAVEPDCAAATKYVVGEC